MQPFGQLDMSQSLAKHLSRELY